MRGHPGLSAANHVVRVIRKEQETAITPLPREVDDNAPVGGWKQRHVHLQPAKIVSFPLNF